MKTQKSEIYWIALTGILMSLVLVIKAIFNYIPVLNGYPLDFYIVFYIFGMVMIDNRKWKWFFGILTPWVLLTIISDSVNFLDMMYEYILALYLFMGFVYFDKLSGLLNKKIKNKKTSMVIQILVFTILLIICFTIKLFIHVSAGVIWYEVNWYGSLVMNGPIIGANLGIALPFTVILYPSMIKIKNNIYHLN